MQQRPQHTRLSLGMCQCVCLIHARAAAYFNKMKYITENSSEFTHATEGNDTCGIHQACAKVRALVHAHTQPVLIKMNTQDTIETILSATQQQTHDIIRTHIHTIHTVYMFCYTIHGQSKQGLY